MFQINSSTFFTTSFINIKHNNQLMLTSVLVNCSKSGYKGLPVDRTRNLLTFSPLSESKEGEQFSKLDLTSVSSIAPLLSIKTSLQKFSNSNDPNPVMVYAAAQISQTAAQLFISQSLTLASPHSKYSLYSAAATYFEAAQGYQKLSTDSNLSLELSSLEGISKLHTDSQIVENKSAFCYISCGTILEALTKKGGLMHGMMLYPPRINQHLIIGLSYEYVAKLFDSKTTLIPEEALTMTICAKKAFEWLNSQNELNYYTAINQGNIYSLENWISKDELPIQKRYLKSRLITLKEIIEKGTSILLSNTSDQFIKENIHLIY